MKEIALTPRILSLPPSELKRNRTCTLVLTQSCNLNCVYCYEKFKTAKSMDVNTAKRCLREQIDLVRRDDCFSWLMVELFGGEPLLRFDVITQLVDYARSLRDACPLMFWITTNGTLLTPDRREWFRKNKDMVSVALSYDGSAVQQRNNRGCDSESALEFCHREWPDMSFRMTVSPQSLPTLAADIKTAVRSGYALRAQLASGMQWTEQDRAVLETQLRELKSFYLSEPSVLPALLPPVFTGTEDSSRPCTQRCGAGVLKVCYDVDGEQYPCSTFSPVSAGPKALKMGSYDPYLPENHNDERCVGCPIKHHCYICPASNWIYRNHPAHRDHGMCRMNLTQVMVTLNSRQRESFNRG